MGIYEGEANPGELPSLVLLGTPHRLVLDAGTVTTTVANIRSITTNGFVLSEGTYWLGIVGQGAPAPQATIRGPGAVANPAIAQTADLAPLTGAFLDGVSGALPDNIGDLISPISGAMAATSLYVDEYL
jgi:hypothetical protein